jgi:hypothetical protein
MFPLERTAGTAERGFWNPPDRLRTVDNVGGNSLSILRVSRGARSPNHLPRRETHLSAERAPPEAAARIPGADVLAWRPRHSETPSRQRAQASLCLRPRGLCSAGIGCRVRGISRTSIGEARRSRRAISSSTGSRGRMTRTATPDLDLPSPDRSARRWYATRSSASSARRGDRACRPFRLDTTMCSSHDRAWPSPHWRAGPGGSRRRSQKLSGRCAREVRGSRAGARVEVLVRAPDAGGNVQVPPELLSVRDRGVPRVRSGSRFRPRRLAPLALQSVEPRRRRLRA